MMLLLVGIAIGYAGRNYIPKIYAAVKAKIDAYRNR